MIACCAPCAASGSRCDSSTVSGVVRAAGWLWYPDGANRVDAHPSSLGEPRTLVGLPVRLGHGGKTIGTVIDARAEGGALHADMRIDDAGALAEIHAGSTREFSCGYVVDVDADGTQRRPRFHEVALVPHGRCGSTCSVTRVADGQRADARLAAEGLSPSEIARTEMIAGRALAAAAPVVRADNRLTSNDLAARLAADGESPSERARAAMRARPSIHLET